MRILFLDIDGVLNAHNWCDEAGSNLILPRCVRQINRVVRSVDRLSVVLTSAWRYMMLPPNDYAAKGLRAPITLAGFAYLLRTHGVSRHLMVAGHTPSDEQISTRGGQIRWWLDHAEGVKHFGVESYAVLDDAPDGMDFRPVREHLVKTDGSVGLTAREADRVIRMLNG